MINTKCTTSLAFATLMTASMVSQANAADLTVTVGPVETATGDVMLAVYNSKDTFRETVLTAKRAAATLGEMVFTFSDLEVGEYAVMVIHDVNGNDKLDTNLMGMPKEPWGGSLQGKRVFGAPGWDDTRFSLADTDVSLSITLN